MNLKQLKKIVAQGESDTVEFKKSTALSHPAFKTICAFLNGRGGVVLIGVTEHGKIVGQEVSDNTQKEIAKEISDIEPSAQAQISISYVSVWDKNKVIIIQVESGPHKPYTYDGRPYHRLQSTSPRMPQHRYEQLIIQRGQLNHSWDESVAGKYKQGMLNKELILSVVNEAVNNKELPASAIQESTLKILERFKLIKDHQVLNAAIVLFGNPCSNYPQCQIKLARFKGTDKREFLDKSQSYGNIFELLEQGELFIKRHLPVAARIIPGQLQRLEIPMIPYGATREALLNALCHRDYSVKGGSIFVAIYDNRMEIYSHGGLLPGLTIKKIKHGFSKPRNNRIADVLHKCGYIENWGRGIQSIIELCKEVKLPRPEFLADDLEFKVIFKFPHSIKPETIISKKNAEALTKRQQEILEILVNHGASPLKEIINKLSSKLAARTLRDDLAYLKKLNLVSLEGFGRSAKWGLVLSEEKK